MDNKPLPTFSFGTPASTTGSSGQSLFGTAGASSNPAAGIFGNPSSGAGNAGGSIFGGSSNKENTGGAGFAFGGFDKPAEKSMTSGEEPKSLFGAPSGNNTSNVFGSMPVASESGASESLFGAAPVSTGGFGGFSFGPRSEDKKQAEGGTSSFAGFGNNLQTPGKAPATSTQIESTTPAANPFAGFGNQSTTPAGPPPTAMNFGASTGGGSSMFGNKNSLTTNTSSATNQSSAAPSLFAAPQSSLKPSSTPNLFGAKPAATPFAGFGSTPAASTASTSAAAMTSEAPKPAFAFGSLGTAGTASLSTAPQSGTTPATTTQTTSTLFGGPTTSAGASKPSASFSFPSSTPSTAAPEQKPSFSGFGPSTSSGPSLFPSFTAPKPATSDVSTSMSTTATATTTAPAPSAFNFGPATTSASAQPSAATSAAPASSSTAALTPGITATATNVGPRPDPQSRLKNKTMDEILTRWASDLTKYTKDFRAHAETVSQWDMLLVENLLETQKLYAKTVTSEKQMQSIEMTLSAVESQQDQLEHWLSKYERDVDEMLEKQGGGGQQELGGPDQEREKTYKLAEKLGERLDDMGRDLQGMIEEVNGVTAGLSKTGKADEPITQIVKILNSHLTQLQDIDRGTNALQAKVAASQQEANRLGYLNGTSNGDGKAAVEDFYRSYMGRR